MVPWHVSGKYPVPGTYISFAPHTRFVPVKTHVHKWIELSYMYSGSCTQIINEEKTVKLEKGQVILLDTDCVHSIGNTGENDILINLLFETINEQILKFAQNYPTISKTASSDAPFFMKV